MQPRIMVVEDDAELLRQIEAAFADEGYDVRTSSHGSSALELALTNRETWDLAILDVSLPGKSGFDIVLELREAGLSQPVIFLTAKSDVSDRIQGLLLGADDYLSKPFSIDELKARVHALLRRRSSYAAAPDPPGLPDGWSINSVLRQLRVREETVTLQPREWSLLELFLHNQGRILTKSFLLDKVWDVRFDPGTNVVDAMVCRLRRKLDPPDAPSHIETVRGRGYVFHRHAQPPGAA